MMNVPIFTRLVETGYRFLAQTSRFTAWKHFEELQGNQWLGRDQIEILRWRKARELLDHCWQNIPFYQERWREAGVDPTRFTGMGDFKHLPIVTKADLIKAQSEDRFLMSRRTDFQMTHTSGTTGSCMYLPFTAADLQFKYAAYLREFYATDWRLGMRSAAMHYSGHPEFAGRYTGRPDRDNFVFLRKAAFEIAHRRALLKPYYHPRSGDESLPAEWYDALRRQRPFLLETMDFNLAALHNHIVERDLPPLRIPRMIVLATIGNEYRARLQEAFSTEIFDRFGPHEIEGVAFACHTHRGMHVGIDCVHAEFLDDQDQPVGPGETGQIVLTDFHSRVMPLVRYRIGDVGSHLEEPCSCGRSFPLMEDVGGRTRDCFETASGGRIAPASVALLLQNEPSIRLFQVVQDETRRVEARVIPDPARWNAAVAGRVREALVHLLGDAGTGIEVIIVDKVDLEFNGKFCCAKRINQTEPSKTAPPAQPSRQS